MSNFHQRLIRTFKGYQIQIKLYVMLKAEKGPYELIKKYSVFHLIKLTKEFEETSLEYRGSLKDYIDQPKLIPKFDPRPEPN